MLLSQGHSRRAMLLLIACFSGVLSALLMNDTVALLMTPFIVR